MAQTETDSRECLRQLAFAWNFRGRRLIVFRKVAEDNTGFPSSMVVHATPACLFAAGQSMPMKLSTSGWRDQSSKASILNGAQWTELVRMFSSASGFCLGRSIRDTPKSKERVPENDGRYQACHAEKKLSLYFLALQIQHVGISLQEALQGRLRQEQLPLWRRRATIVLGHKPCKNCSVQVDFLRFIQRRTGVCVKAMSAPVFTEHIRQRTFFSAPDGVRQAREPSPKLPIANGPDDNGENTLSTDGSDLGGYNVVSECSDGRDGDNIDSQVDPPLPPEPTLPARRLSVASTESPAYSTPPWGSSPLPGELRSLLYTTPPRTGGPGTAPEAWGRLGKPPVTPCQEPPEFWLARGENGGQNRLGVSQESCQEHEEQSFYFETASEASQESTGREPREGAVANAQTDEHATAYPQPTPQKEAAISGDGLMLPPSHPPYAPRPAHVLRREMLPVTAHRQADLHLPASPSPIVSALPSNARSTPTPALPPVERSSGLHSGARSPLHPTWTVQNMGIKSNIVHFLKREATGRQPPPAPLGDHTAVVPRPLPPPAPVIDLASDRSYPVQVIVDEDDEDDDDLVLVKVGRLGKPRQRPPSQPSQPDRRQAPAAVPVLFPSGRQSVLQRHQFQIGNARRRGRPRLSRPAFSVARGSSQNTRRQVSRPFPNLASFRYNFSGIV